jgi:CubicO group peptidase (beta-lactamase class C family)
LGVAILLSILARPAPLSPQSSGQTLDASRETPPSAEEFFHRVGLIRDFLEEFVDTSAVPGVSLALGIGDAFTRFEAFGYADLEEERPVTPHTRFRIGSVSKALTAAALGALVEEGRLDLDATVRHYVPESPRKSYPITLRQLALHRGGIRHYRGEEALSNRHFERVIDALSVFAADPLVAEPGTAFNYSTYGYTLLSAAMEATGGVPFLELMEQRVLGPIGMTRTGPEVKGQIHPLQAKGYEPGMERGIRVPPETDLSNKWAGGGYVSTAGDLLKFARAHMKGEFLQSWTLDLLWASDPEPGAGNPPMGIGWQVARLPDGKRLLVAGGDAIGGTTVLFVLPDVQTVVVFMTNMGHAPIRGVPMRVLEFLLGAERS